MKKRVEIVKTLLQQGKSKEEIMQELQISARTFYNYRKKLNINSFDKTKAITTIFTKRKHSTPKVSKNSKEIKPTYDDMPLAAQGIPSEILNELLNRITKQAAEIGRLNERIAQLEKEKGHIASNAQTSGVANAG